MAARAHLVAMALALSGAGSAVRNGPDPPCRDHHLRLYVYASEHVRPRHAAVVQKALEQRARVHSSGFADDGGAPRLAIGPVNDRVFHWRWDAAREDWDRNTSMAVAWPFVAVLEYDGRSEPRAWIDWFRRAKGQDAWTKDPADQRYAKHIGDAYATAHDDRFCYLAVVDTPTGGVVFGQEWVVRARVEWAGALVTKRAGVHLWFERQPRLEDWHSVQHPLVDRVPVTAAASRRIAIATRPVERPEEQLARLGTTTVFTFPPIPADVVPARGFPR